MEFDFTKLKPEPVFSPPLIVLYGAPGIGKTAFGVGAGADTEYKVGKENHLLVNVDHRGADRLTCSRASTLIGRPIGEKDKNNRLIPRLTQDFKTIFKNLAEVKHNFSWIVFDDLSTMEELFVDEVCKENNVDDLKKIDYGRGFDLAKDKWHLFFDMVEHLQSVKPIGVILIGHTRVESKKDPMTESYSRHGLQLDKRSREIIMKGVDLVAFASREVSTMEKDAGFGKKTAVPIDSKRIISFTPEVEGFESKDRFNLPPSLPLDWNTFAAELKKALNKYLVEPKGTKKKEKETK